MSGGTGTGTKIATPPDSGWMADDLDVFFSDFAVVATLTHTGTHTPEVE